MFRKIESESVDADEEIGEEEERYKKGAIVFGICMGLILFGAVMSPFMAESANKNVKSTNVSSEIVLEKNSRKNAESELTEDKNTESVQTEAQSTESLVSEYILAGSDSRYITREEIENLSLEECRLARNELYARRGRYFSDKELQDYFNACSWYEPYIQPEDFQDSVFNQYELANRDLLLQYERELN
ncbi:MAG: YARHG domain-containing protein [bacterium]|nr:YARHG domain-containing protein [bacterium]